VADDPTQREGGLVIAGNTFTDTDFEALHPDAVVYMMLTTPLPVAVTSPLVAPTIATVELDVLQVPPVAVQE
jgi:hypothetical protein